MLTMPLEKLAYIVAKAREFDAEVPPVDEDFGLQPLGRRRARCAGVRR